MKEPMRIDICNGMQVGQNLTSKKIGIGVPANSYWLYVTREEAKELIPILQRFAETGSIEETLNADALNRLDEASDMQILRHKLGRAREVISDLMTVPDTFRHRDIDIDAWKRWLGIARTANDFLEETKEAAT